MKKLPVWTTNEKIGKKQPLIGNHILIGYISDNGWQND